MANVKISQLDAAAALTGTEELPIVQDGATVKTTTQDIADLSGLPYKVCVLNMNTDGSTWSIENTFQDTIGVTLTSISSQRFRLTSTGNFTLSKVMVLPMFLAGQSGKMGVLDWTFVPTINNITIRISDISTGDIISPTSKGDNVQWILEVRVYP